MSQFEIQSEQTIPYFDHDKKLSKTIANSSARRNMSPIRFAIRKIRNTILSRMAERCPFNSLRVKMHRKRGVHIGNNVYIGQRCILDNAYPEFIYIEDNVSLAGGVTVIAHANPYKHFENVIASTVAPIVVSEGAWVGVKAILLKGVVIGKKSIISAGTVVDRDVPDYTIAKGNPMKILTNFESIL